MRYKYCKIAIGILSISLVFGVLKIQIIGYRYYKKQAQANYVRYLRIPPLRGKIYDRNGKILADWTPSFRLSITKEKVSQEQLESLEKILNRSLDREKIRTAPLYLPLIENVDFNELVTLEEYRDQFPWILTTAIPRRFYRYAEPISHLIGYVGEISAQELRNLKDYRPGDIIGRSGVEKEYENHLKGKSGARFLMVDATGSIVLEDPRPMVPPEKGEDLILTIDAELQSFVDSLLADYRRASVVAIDVKTGDILILYSSPTFDPNQLSYGLTEEEWDSLREDPDNPLLNRAISGLYPPASIFKLVTAMGGLELKVITPYKKLIPCTGEYRFGDRVWKCWKEEGHGELILTEAIEQSCDVYFYQVAQRIGLKRFLDYIDKLELNRRYGVGIPGEKTGFIPDISWYREKYGRYGYGEGNVLNLGIGQGEVLLTPLQITVLTALIATGTMPEPHIVLREEGDKTISIDTPDSVLVWIRRGMREVVNGEKGTGKLAGLPDVEIAGKTGTAQNPQGDDHSLFTAFAPYISPEIAITVVIENAGHGGAVAAPITREILRYYFYKKSLKDHPEEY